MSSAFRRFSVLVVSLLFASGLPAATGAWIPTWLTALQEVETNNLPPEPGLIDTTLRQVIQPTLAGSQVRVTFSNQYGEKPLVIASAAIARSTGGARVDPAHGGVLTFNGRPGTTIPTGALVVSDPVDLAVAAFENLAVSVHCTAAPATVTGHPGSRTTSFLVKGDAVAAEDLAEAVKTDHWYLLAAVDVRAEPGAAAIVIVGDSITDGRGSTTNGNDRWPNLLARRLHADPRTANLAVLNQGIGGNCILRRGLGPSVLERFDRDVLVPAGVRWLVIFEGVNDIGGTVSAAAHGKPAATAQDLIDAYRQLALRARTRGLSVIGATIMPFEGFAMYSTPESESMRQAVNDWIRHGGCFDAVIDFDAIARDPQNPRALSAAVDGGDHLHPSAAGYRVMVDGIDLAIFSK